MGISELVLIALIGLALFGGNINISFEGLLRRGGRRELQAGGLTPAQKKLQGGVKKAAK